MCSLEKAVFPGGNPHEKSGDTPKCFFLTRPKWRELLDILLERNMSCLVNLRMEKGGGSNKSQRANDAKHFKLALLTFLLYLVSIS